MQRLGGNKRVFARLSQSLKEVSEANNIGRQCRAAIGLDLSLKRALCREIVCVVSEPADDVSPKHLLLLVPVGEFRMSQLIADRMVNESRALGVGLHDY
jgi:hypothetical protein